MTVEHYVEYLFPGSFTRKSPMFRLQQRSLDEAISKCPDGAFAFSLYDVQVRAGTLEDGETITDRKIVNRSGRYYPQGVSYTVEQVEALNDPDHRILISNMRCNGYERVVLTRRGNWQPLTEKDAVLA